MDKLKTFFRTSSIGVLRVIVGLLIVLFLLTLLVGAVTVGIPLLIIVGVMILICDLGRHIDPAFRGRL